MQKGKTLSFILASLLSLSQIAPGMAISQKAYASTDKVENEITSKIDHNLEDGNQKKDKIDVDTNLRIVVPKENTYPEPEGKYTKWIFTLRNNSDKPVYLGGISTPPSDKDSSDMISKNIYIERFEVDTHGLYEYDYLKKFILDVSFKKADKVEGETRERHLGSYIDVSSHKAIYANFKFRKTLEIPAKKSIDIEISTSFFDKDYNNPFDKREWKRKDGNDNTCLFNTDHAMSLKVNLYYDKDGKEPIRKEDFPQDSNFNDQASGSFQLKARVGDLSFGNANKPSKVLIKKSGKDDFDSAERAEANTNETLRFVVPVKISNAKDAYQAALKKAGHKQYLINPRFLIEKEADDDSSLEQEFYIRKTADDSLVKLKKTEVTEGGKTYYELALPDTGLSDFMTDFDFVYNVKFTDSKRTHGLDKKVKLAFDNLGNVINTNDDLTIDLKADYLEAKKFCQVEFDLGKQGEKISQSVKKDELAQKPVNPKAEGYSFEGWYADEKFKNKFEFENPITKNTTIYAKWAKLFDITYEFVSGTAGKDLPASINDLLKKIENKKYKVGETVEAPDIEFKPIKVDGETWTFAGWDNKEIVVSENSEKNKFTGKWNFAKDNQPQPGNNDNDGKGNQNQPPKPGEETGGNTDGKGGEHSDNPKYPEPDKNKDKDKKDGGKDKPSSGDKDRKDSDKKDSDKKPSLKPEDTKAPKEKVIRVNTDIYRPIPKGYKRVYFDPGKNACLKYNPSFDYGEVIAFDVKETMTFGEAKAEDKGLVIPIAIPKDKSLKFAGWSPKLQADGEFVEGVKYVALYEKIDKDQETSNIKKSDKNSSKKGQDLVKAEDKKDKKNEKLISDGEISKKENAKAQNSLANKAKAQINKYTSPRTGVASLGLVTGILALSSAGLFLSKKSK